MHEPPPPPKTRLDAGGLIWKAKTAAANASRDHIPRLPSFPPKGTQQKKKRTYHPPPLNPLGGSNSLPQRPHERLRLFVPHMRRLVEKDALDAQRLWPRGVHGHVALGIGQRAARVVGADVTEDLDVGVAAELGDGGAVQRVREAGVAGAAGGVDDDGEGDVGAGEEAGGFVSVGVVRWGQGGGCTRRTPASTSSCRRGRCTAGG